MPNVVNRAALNAEMAKVARAALLFGMNVGKDLPPAVANDEATKAKFADSYLRELGLSR